MDRPYIPRAGDFPYMGELAKEYTADIWNRNKILPFLRRAAGHDLPETNYGGEAVKGLVSEYEIKRIFDRFNAAGIRGVLLRGLYLGIEVYGDPSLRPFKDIDILIEKNNIGKAGEALRNLGYYYSPSILSESFFLEAHLHLVYFHPKYRILCEVHWAIDHPFTHYAVKMDEVFKTAVPSVLRGIRCFDIKRELRFILLLVHIQKHIPYIKYQHDMPEIAGRIIKDGELLHMLDAHLFLKRYADGFDWDFFIKKAAEWNIDEAVYAALKTAKKIFNSCIPDELFMRLERPADRPLEKFLADVVVPAVERMNILSGLTERLVFTSKRLPDLYTWLFPCRKTIKREYPGGVILYSYIRNIGRCFLKILGAMGRVFRTDG